MTLASIPCTRPAGATIARLRDRNARALTARHPAAKRAMAIGARSRPRDLDFREVSGSLLLHRRAHHLLVAGAEVELQLVAQVPAPLLRAALAGVRGAHARLVEVRLPLRARGALDTRHGRGRRAQLHLVRRNKGAHQHRKDLHGLVRYKSTASKAQTVLEPK